MSTLEGDDDDIAACAASRTAAANADSDLIDSLLLLEREAGQSLHLVLAATSTLFNFNFSCTKGTRG